MRDSKPGSEATRSGKKQPRTGARMLNYLLLSMGLCGAAPLVLPNLVPELVRVEAADAVPPIPLDLSAGKARAKSVKIGKDRKQINEFFLEDPVPTLSFELDPQEWEYLKKDARRYAEAVMTDDTGRRWEGVAIKCKGSAGSFQGPEQKPGLTVSMKKYKGADRWRGFGKWHLNNGAQDATYLHEQISGEMARRAGVPASRCAHALVKLQGRELGLYVFKEAFDKDFLAHFFDDVEGDLYDGGFVADIRPEMEKDEGDPKNVANIKELIEACREGDQVKRWARLEKILDVEKFASFFAMECILGHWDGYSFNRNNYRLYFDPGSGKAVFMLHGMDQTLADANAPAFRDPGAMVSQAVMSNPDWKALCRDRVEQIYNEVLVPIDWPGRVSEVGKRVIAALEKKNPQLAKDYANAVTQARDHVANRIAAIGKQLGDMPKPMKFDPAGLAKLPAEGWRQEGSAAQSSAVIVEDKPCFYLRAEGESNASWRRTVTLTPGKYRFEARVKTLGVMPVQSSSGAGAGVRISGGQRSGENSLEGDVAWKQVSFEFDAPGGDVVLVAELRASKGEAWFERDSLQLVRMK